MGLNDGSVDLLAEEEIEVLSAIYNDEFSIVESDKSLQAHWLNSSSLNSLYEELLSIAVSNTTPVVYSLVEAIRSFLQSHLKITNYCDQGQCNEDQILPSISTSQNVFEQSSITTVPSVKAHLQLTSEFMPIAVGHRLSEIFHGEMLVDRKSVFQCHCARVTKCGEVSLFITTLLKNRKIATATHNILAWRLQPNSDVKSNIVSDCDDDGETHAGARLLHLLTISRTVNVAVMVSRWFGGILLGPDRFKHINNVARVLLQEKGFLDANCVKQKKKK